MRTALSRTCLQAALALAALAAAVTPAGAQNRYGTQGSIDLYLAENAPCGPDGGPEGQKFFAIIDADAVDDCDEEGGGETLALCACDDGERRSTQTPAEETPAATTTVAGLVELATSGENAGNVVVQGNDTRINAPRTLRVYTGATDVVGKTYNTIKEAVDYIATQTHDATNRWQVQVQGGGEMVETPFTIPSFAEVVCSAGGRIYDQYTPGTMITAEVLEGSFITMEASSELRNCAVYASGNTTAARTVVACAAANGYACHLDHVGVISDEAGASTQANIGISAVAGGNGVLSLYYVFVGLPGGNTGASAIKVGAANGLQFDNGLLHPGGASGKGIQSLADSPGYIWVKNVQVGAPYAGTGFTTDLSEEGTGTLYVQDVVYKSSSGTITSNEPGHDWTGSAPPVACSASTITTKYWDTDIGKVCQCNGTNYVLTTDFSTTTGCS